LDHDLFKNLSEKNENSIDISQSSTSVNSEYSQLLRKSVASGKYKTPSIGTASTAKNTENQSDERIETNLTSPDTKFSEKINEKKVEKPCLTPSITSLESSQSSKKCVKEKPSKALFVSTNLASNSKINGEVTSKLDPRSVDFMKEKISLESQKENHKEFIDSNIQRITESGSETAKNSLSNRTSAGSNRSQLSNLQLDYQSDSFPRKKTVALKKMEDRNSINSTSLSSSSPENPNFSRSATQTTSLSKKRTSINHEHKKESKKLSSEKTLSITDVQVKIPKDSLLDNSLNQSSSPTSFGNLSVKTLTKRHSSGFLEESTLQKKPNLSVNVDKVQLKLDNDLPASPQTTKQTEILQNHKITFSQDQELVPSDSPNNSSSLENKIISRNLSQIPDLVSHSSEFEIITETEIQSSTPRRTTLSIQAQPSTREVYTQIDPVRASKIDTNVYAMSTTSDSSFNTHTIEELSEIYENRCISQHQKITKIEESCSRQQTTKVTQETVVIKNKNKRYKQSIIGDQRIVNVFTDNGIQTVPEEIQKPELSLAKIEYNEVNQKDNMKDTKLIQSSVTIDNFDHEHVVKPQPFQSLHHKKPKIQKYKMHSSTNQKRDTLQELLNELEDYDTQKTKTFGESKTETPQRRFGKQKPVFSDYIRSHNLPGLKFTCYGHRVQLPVSQNNPETLNPYFLVIYNNDSEKLLYQSEYIFDTSQPVFSEASLSKQLLSLDDELTFQFWGYTHTGPDRYICETRLKVGDFLNSQSHRHIQMKRYGNPVKTTISFNVLGTNYEFDEKEGYRVVPGTNMVYRSLNFPVKTYNPFPMSVSSENPLGNFIKQQNISELKIKYRCQLEPLPHLSKKSLYFKVKHNGVVIYRSEILDHNMICTFKAFCLGHFSPSDPFTCQFKSQKALSQKFSTSGSENELGVVSVSGKHLLDNKDGAYFQLEKHGKLNGNVWISIDSNSREQADSVFIDTVSRTKPKFSRDDSSVFE